MVESADPASEVEQLRAALADRDRRIHDLEDRLAAQDRRQREVATAVVAAVGQLPGSNAA